MKKAVQIIDSLSVLKKHLLRENHSQIFVLCDENTKQKVYLDFEKELGQFFNFQLLDVKAGERSKSLNSCSYLWEKLSEFNADRDSLLINLGGGMVSDLGAFIASVYKRGIAFINLPTSLLGMTDAAIGNKCGIDFLNYKNQIGLFSSADRIFIYPRFLKTLPAIELKSGFAEVLKHALIADKMYWHTLSKINPEEWSAVAKVVHTSVNIKLRIVEEDPLENGQRKMLNFGHTIGHALESYCMKHQRIVPHGYAVAAGMLVETYLSIKYTNLSKKEYEEIAGRINQFYPSINFEDAAVDEILTFIRQDKKAEKKGSRFTLLNAIGSAVYDIEIAEDDIIAALVKYKNDHAKA